MAIAKTTLKGLPGTFGEAAFDELAALYEGAARQLMKLADRRITKATARLAIRGPGRLTVNAERSRAALLEVERILEQLDQDAARWISQNIPPAYRAGARRTIRGLREIGFESLTRLPFSATFHGNAIQLLMLDLQDNLLGVTRAMRTQFNRLDIAREMMIRDIELGEKAAGQMLTTLRRTQLPRELDRQMTRIIAEGQIAGQTRRQVSRRLQKALRDGVGDKIVINGRNFKVGPYSRLVARTKTREAVVAASVNRQIESGNDLIMVTSHGATDGCGFYEGRVFSISGASEKYPPLAVLPNGGPPFHPNCKHSTAPFVEPLASPTETRRAAKIDQRALGKDYGEVEKLAQRVGV